MAIFRSGFFSSILILHIFAFSVPSLLEEKTLVSAQDEEVGNGEIDGGICSLDLNSFLPPPYGNLSQMNCQPVWNTFVLRHSQSKENVVTFVLSALYTSGWVGIGFSKNGKMIGSSAVVGWISRSGHARIKQYHAKGYTSTEVKPGRGDLNFTSIPPVIVLDGANLYLAFQLKFSAPFGRHPTLFAFSSRYPSVNTHELPQHDDKTSILIDYSAGIAAPASSNKYDKIKRSHGVLGIIGWGLILPVGAMVARYLKHREPLWYYLHTVIQFVGFLIGLAGVVVGQTLYNDIHGNSFNANVAAHRGIGYFALTLSILQVLAFFIRPNRDSKIRGIWNLYHMSFGILALFFGALNIVFGIQVGDAGSQWKIGYGFLLGIIVVATIVLQVLSMLRSSSDNKIDQPPAYQMN